MFVDSGDFGPIQTFGSVSFSLSNEDFLGPGTLTRTFAYDTGWISSLNLDFFYLGPGVPRHVYIVSSVSTSARSFNPPLPPPDVVPEPGSMSIWLLIAASSLAHFSGRFKGATHGRFKKGRFC